MSTGTPTTITQTSTITESLVELLRKRSEIGLAKYGTTLDRTDLSPRDWITHTIEELLDASGYLLALDRELSACSEEARELLAENQRLRTENERMSAALRPLLELAQTLGLSAPVAVQEAPAVMTEEPIILTSDKMIGAEPVKETADSFTHEEQPAKKTPENVTSNVTSEARPVGLTRAQIGEALGCHPGSCSKWERDGIISRIPGTGTSAQNPVLYPENTPEILLAHRAATEEKMRSVGYATGLKNIKPTPELVKPDAPEPPAQPVCLNTIMGSPRDPMGLVRAATERGWDEILIGFNARESTLVAAAVGPLPPHFTLACTIFPEANSVMIPITANSIGRTIGESIKDAIEGKRKAGLE